MLSINSAALGQQPSSSPPLGLHLDVNDPELLNFPVIHNLHQHINNNNNNNNTIVHNSIQHHSTSTLLDSAYMLDEQSAHQHQQMSMFHHRHPNTTLSSFSSMNSHEHHQHLQHPSAVCDQCQNHITTINQLELELMQLRISYQQILENNSTLSTMYSQEQEKTQNLEQQLKLKTQEAQETIQKYNHLASQTERKLVTPPTSNSKPKKQSKQPYQNFVQKLYFK